MKAKNFPKKIYLQENTTTDCYDEIWPEWFEASSKDSDVEYIRKDALADKINELIKALKRQNPDPLGTTTQCLAAAEIEALKIVLETMNELK